MNLIFSITNSPFRIIILCLLVLCSSSCDRNVLINNIKIEDARKLADTFKRLIDTEKYDEAFSLMDPISRALSNKEETIRTFIQITEKFGKTQSSDFNDYSIGAKLFPNNPRILYPMISVSYKTITEGGELQLRNHILKIEVLKVKNKLWITSYFLQPIDWHQKIKLPDEIDSLNGLNKIIEIGS